MAQNGLFTTFAQDGATTGLVPVGRLGQCSVVAEEPTPAGLSDNALLVDGEPTPAALRASTPPRRGGLPWVQQA